MLPELSKIKGVHPGAILKRALNRQGLKGSELARHVGEHKQTISAILNKRRDINPKLSIKLSKQFDVAEDYFMLIQASHDVKKIIDSELKNTPNLDKFRDVLFWDTTIDKIDWDKNKKAVIQRVLERGNDTEIMELISFYGKANIMEEIESIKSDRLPSFEQNILKYNLR
jgi:addiction module HigA family antidote